MKGEISEFASLKLLSDMQAELGGALNDVGGRHGDGLLEHYSFYTAAHINRAVLAERFILVHSFDPVRVGALDVIAAEIDFAACNVQFAPGWRKHARQDFHDGRLTGSVVTDQTHDLVAANFQSDVSQRTHQAKILLDVDHPERVLFDGLLDQVAQHRALPWGVSGIIND